MTLEMSLQFVTKRFFLIGMDRTIENISSRVQGVWGSTQIKSRHTQFLGNGAYRLRMLSGGSYFMLLACFQG
jgi:hypothetical protein